MSRNSKGYCQDCDIWVHDEETLQNHKIGKPHLKLLQRIKEDKARKALSNYDSSNTRTGMNYYELPSQFSERIGKFYKENGNHFDDPRSNSHKKDHCSNINQNSPYKENIRHRSRSPIRPRSRNDSSSDYYDKEDRRGRDIRGRERNREYNRRRSRSSFASRSRSNSSSDSYDKEDRSRNDRRGTERNRKSPSRHDREKNGASATSYSTITPPSVNNEYRAKIEPEIKKINGQFYCEPCDTYCARMDVMTSHLSGKNHKKKTKQITRFACDLCLIEVSSAETLQTHYQGMSHIKRAAVLEEGKKESEYHMDESANVMEELSDLRQRCQKLERQNVNLQKEVDQLIKFKRNCTDTHQKFKFEGVKKMDPSYNGVVLE